MEFLKNRIKKTNQRIIDNAMILKQDEIDKLNRKFDWVKGNCSGINGSELNENGNLTFEI